MSKWAHVLLQENYLLLGGQKVMDLRYLFRMLQDLVTVCSSKFLGLADLKDLGTRHSVGLPIHVYPLYENAFRAHRGQPLAENNAESAKLYAEFAKVAEKNPMAWNYGQRSASEEVIGTVSKKNRMICSPCELSIWIYVWC